MKEKTRFVLFVVPFASLYFIPFRNSTVSRSIIEAVLRYKYFITGASHLLLFSVIIAWFKKEELKS